MSIRKSSILRLLLGATCLAGAAALPAFAGPAPVVSDAGRLSHALVPHDVIVASAQAIADAAKAPGKIAPVTAEAAAADAAAAAGPMTAADLDRDRPTGPAVCEGYFTQSQALSPLLEPAVEAMTKHDVASLTSQLPGLETALNALPGDEVRPELCGGTHINAYTRLQFVELNAERAHGVDIGFPANLPIVKQPDMNQPGLAFLVGWTKYEGGDFIGAQASLEKGLGMFPNAPSLQQEYVATLVKLQQGARVVNYVDSVFAHTTDLDDNDRATLFVARATGLLELHALDAAEQNLVVALAYHRSQEIMNMLTQVRSLKAMVAQQGAKQ